MNIYDELRRANRILVRAGIDPDYAPATVVADTLLHWARKHENEIDDAPDAWAERIALEVLR